MGSRAGHYSPGHRGSAHKNAASAAATRPTISHQIAPDQMSDEEKVAWVRQVLPGVDEHTASAVATSAYDYSVSAYDAVHADREGNLQDTKNILKLFDSPNVPVYSGEIHRGVGFDSMEDIDKVLSSGVWMEKSISSFSTRQDIARRFAAHNGVAKLVLTCTNNKTAIPFQHLSHFGNDEAEILSPGSHRTKGWKLDMSSKRVVGNTVYINMEEM